MKVVVLLAKSVLAPLGVTAAASAIDAGIQKKIAQFRYNNLNDFKRKNEWHKENCSSPSKF